MIREFECPSVLRMKEGASFAGMFVLKLPLLLPRPLVVVLVLVLVLALVLALALVLMPK